MLLRDAITVDELAESNLGVALSNRLAGSQLAVLRFLAVVSTLVWAIVALSNMANAPIRAAFSGLVALASFVLVRVIGRLLVRPDLRERVSVAIVVAFLAAQQGLSFAWAWGEGLEPALFLPPMISILFVVAAASRVALHAVWFGVDLLVVLGYLADRGESSVLGLIPAALFFHGFVLVVGLLRARRARRGVSQAWELGSTLHEDRLRMQRELETARAIQLSMLPTHGPALDWIDWAALSLPAAEVGGDYYDHRVAPDGTLVVAIADVAGHGLASGLLLSGLRACLALLEDVEDSAEVLRRLHTMVRRTRHERSFITLALLRLARDGRAELAAAGHPPMLVARADGSVVEIGGSSTPLGAMRDLHPVHQALQIGPGDVVLLTTDGIYEMASPTGEALGIDGLGRALAAAVAEVGADARAVRERLLRTLWEHKGTAPQEDDLTLVVLVVRYLPTQDQLPA